MDDFEDHEAEALAAHPSSALEEFIPLLNGLLLVRNTHVNPREDDVAALQSSSFSSPHFKSSFIHSCPLEALL